MQAAYEICESEDRSTEYMIAFIMDTANVSHAAVMEFLFEKSEDA
jgi:hypothetical protein